jgi:hypothetical protein
MFCSYNSEKKPLATPSLTVIACVVTAGETAASKRAVIIAVLEPVDHGLRGQTVSHRIAPRLPLALFGSRPGAAERVPPMASICRNEVIGRRTLAFAWIDRGSSERCQLSPRCRDSRPPPRSEVLPLVRHAGHRAGFVATAHEPPRPHQPCCPPTMRPRRRVDEALDDDSDKGARCIHR